MRFIFISSLFLALFSVIPSLEAKEFVVARPSTDEIVRAIADASEKTRVRSALLYGLLAQETDFGSNLGKTEKEWESLCRGRTTESCRKWRTYDCKREYANARRLEDILKSLGLEKGSVPTSSTCALGFTQFEPSTWYEIVSRHREKVYDPWNIQDALLVAAYHLEGLGADNIQSLGPQDVIGAKDFMALKRYYCGGKYWRQECEDYARQVERRARNAYETLLKRDLERQLRILEERRRQGTWEVMQCPAVSTVAFEFGTMPDPVRAKAFESLLDSATRDLLDTLRRFETAKEPHLVKNIQEQALRRKEHLVEAFYRNPDIAVFSILLENDRKSLLRFITNCIETEETIEGVVESLHIDFEEGASQSQYTLTTDDGKVIVLHPALGLRIPLESGTRVRVRGIRIDNELLFNGARSLEDPQDFTGGIEVR